MMTNEDILNKARKLPKNIQFKAELKRKYSNVSFRIEIIEVSLDSLLQGRAGMFKETWIDHRDNDSFRFFKINMMELIDDIPEEQFIYMAAAMDPKDFVKTYTFMVNITKYASKLNNFLHDCKFNLSWTKFPYDGAAYFEGKIRNKEIFFNVGSSSRNNIGNYTSLGFDCKKTVIEQFTWDGQTMAEQLALRLK